LSELNNIYWDSCVFYRFLTQKPFNFVDDISRFIEDAKKGTRKIYCSTIVLAEIRAEALKRGNIQDFFASLKSAVNLVDPDPNIMIMAGQLKDSRAVNPGDIKGKARVVGTADAIHLATCIYLRDQLGISDVVFHTFDDGKGATWEGKCIPLLSFERWYPAKTRTPIVGDVCDLTRCKPSHPEKGLFSGEATSPLNTQSRH
jgi:predicted nucleic acid-binding protein